MTHLEQALFSMAESYASHKGLKLSTLSSYACNDGKVFEKIPQGSSITLRRLDQLLEWFSENWPDDLEWPTAFHRPGCHRIGAAVSASFVDTYPLSPLTGLPALAYGQGTSAVGADHRVPTALSYSPSVFPDSAPPNAPVPARAVSGETEARAADNNNPPQGTSPASEVHQPARALSVDDEGRARHQLATTHGAGSRGPSFFERHPLREIAGDTIGAAAIFVMLFGLLFAQLIFS